MKARKGKDSRCAKCGHCFDWLDLFLQKPPCPQCGNIGHRDRIGLYGDSKENQRAQAFQAALAEKSMPRFSWKKTRGRGQVCSIGFDLNYGGRTYAQVRGLAGSKWYWFGFGQNTALHPVLRYTEAQAQCLAYAKEKLAELKEKFQESS